MVKRISQARFDDLLETRVNAVCYQLEHLKKVATNRGAYMNSRSLRATEAHMVDRLKEVMDFCHEQVKEASGESRFTLQQDESNSPPVKK